MPKHAPRLPADERRAVTVQAVIDLAAEQNPGDITTAAIAQRMGVTQGSLFRHFPNKEAILQAVIDWVAQRMLARITHAIDGAASPLAALEAIFMTHVNFIMQHRGVPRMLVGELQRPEETLAKRAVRSLMTRYRQRIEHVIGEAQAAGQLAAGIDPGFAALLFLGAIQAMVLHALLSNDLERMGQDAPQVFALYRRGIAARDNPASSDRDSGARQGD